MPMRDAAAGLARRLDSQNQGEPIISDQPDQRTRMETLSGRADASVLVAAVDRSRLLTLRKLCLDVRRNGGDLTPDESWEPFEPLLRAHGYDRRNPVHATRIVVAIGERLRPTGEHMLANI